MRTFPDKDPYALLDYVFDWSDWLGEDEIVEYDIVVPTGIVLEQDSQADGKVTVWLSGGEINKFYIVECSISTLAGRLDTKSALLPVKNT